MIMCKYSAVAARRHKKNKKCPKFDIYIYIYIVVKEKTLNIFKVKIFRLLPLSIHNLS